MGMKSSVIRGLSSPTPIWKTVPGDPWVNGDVATATHGSIVFVEISAGEEMTLNLPAITPESVGKRVQVINLLQEIYESCGDVFLNPNGTDSIEALNSLNAVDIESWVDNDEMKHFWLESNGVDRWSMVWPRSGDYWLDWSNLAPP